MSDEKFFQLKPYIAPRLDKVDTWQLVTGGSLGINNVFTWSEPSDIEMTDFLSAGEQ